MKEPDAMNHFLLCALSLFFLAFATPASSLDATFVEGIAKAHLTLNSELVDVSVNTIALPSNYAYRNAYTWGGDETSPPKRMISAITILKDGHIIYVPLSAFVDLGDPTRISLQKLPMSGFRLSIRGGDAAGSYSATLDFRKDEILRRRVESGEFPKEVWESTTFSFNHLAN